MLAVLSEWVTNLVVVIFLAVVLELLLPNNSLRRAVSLVVGFVFVAALLGPFFNQFGNGFSQRLEEGRQLEELLGWSDDLLGRPASSSAVHGVAALQSGAAVGPGRAEVDDAQKKLEAKAREQALSLYRSGLEKQIGTLVQNLVPTRDIRVKVEVDGKGEVTSIHVRAELANRAAEPPGTAPRPGAETPKSPVDAQAGSGIDVARIEDVSVQVRTVGPLSGASKNGGGEQGPPGPAPTGTRAGAALDAGATGLDRGAAARASQADLLQKQIKLYTGVPGERIQVELVGEG